MGSGRGPSGRGRRRSGELEGEVLAILWSSAGPMTASEVLAACAGDLAYNTVHTVLTRLQAKGRIRRIADGGHSAYEPAKGAAEVAAEQMHAALDRGLDRPAILARFVTTLSAADEAALRAALASEG